MKQIIGIRLVQFFMYEREDVTLGRRCSGIFGPNGSGKSSLLDAVQIVMLGASAHRGNGVVFNAQADEKKASTRSIRAYCLGQYDVMEGARVREESTTYITLVWKDTKTHEMISTGVCIAASAQKDSHDVRGRFVFRGNLSLGDHLQIVDGQECPRSWESFREQLRQRSGSEDEIFFQDSERFVKAILLALRGDGGVAQIDAFRQAFRFGLKMGFDKSIDEIVRYQVIEDRPTNIQRFRENFQLWKRVQALVAETSAKVASADIITGHYDEALKFHRRAATWPALGKAIALEAANERVNRAEEDEAKAQDDLDRALTLKAKTEEQAQTAQAAALQAATKRDTHQAHTQQQLAQQQLDYAKRLHSEKRAELQRTLQAVASRLSGVGKSGLGLKAEAEAKKAAEALSELIAQMMARPELPAQADVEPVVRSGLVAAKKVAEEALSCRADVERQLKAAQDDLQSAQDDLKRVSQGKAPLDGSARALKALLNNAGIDATPVCDLVDIDDPAWQPVIEAYLGLANVQALLIESGKDDEKRAFQIYRGSNVYGAKLASSSRHEHRKTPPTGSVAELIRSKSSNAAANYLRSKFGDCMRAQDERDSFTHHASLTVDGMLFRDGELDRIRPLSPAMFRIGPVTQAMTSSLQSALTKAQAAVKALEAQRQVFVDLYNVISVFVGDVHERMAHVMGLLKDAQSHAQAALAHQAQIDQLGSSDYEAVRKAADEAAARAQQSREQATAAATAAGAAQQALEQKVRQAQEARDTQQHVQTEAARAKQAEDFDADYFAEQWDKLIAELSAPGVVVTPSTMAELEGKCMESAMRAQRNSAAKANDAQDALTKYLVEFPREHLPDSAMQSWLTRSQWVRERRAFLASTELPERQQDANEALETARNIFRNDVAVHINERLDWLSATFDRLNDALRLAPSFTNGERYSFKRTVRPQYQALHKFITDVTQFGPTEDLLGGAGEVPPEFDRLMRDQIDPEAKVVKSPLDDYREFFEFDVQILREDPATGARRPVGLLSQRVGPGSGGEHRSPLYVIAGAAMASAYHAKPGDDSGLRLILLDEAFIKMDPHNIVSTMRYFEELGLQVFMASTGDALGTLMAFMDRYYDIMRDPFANSIWLSGHEVDDATREMFRADMAEFHPDLIDREVERLQAAAVAD